MDKKLELMKSLSENGDKWAHDEITLTIFLVRIEQAFRDTGWTEPQQSVARELVENPYLISPNLSLNGEWPEVREKRLMCELKRSIFDEGSKAQLAHDKTRIEGLEAEIKTLAELLREKP